MNPNAKEFKFNPGVSPWQPPSFTMPQAPVSEPLQVSEQPPIPTPIIEQAKISQNEEWEARDEGEDAEDEPIDENDPLWQAALKIGGSKAAALKLLENPDSLIKYPEVAAIMDAQATAETEDDDDVKTKAAKVGDQGEDWEANGGSIKESAISTSADLPYADIDKGVVTTTKSMSALVLDSTVSTAAADDDGPGVASDDDVVAEVDPREHLNIVFIGHVDAGKSTLSGAILYCMGKVDKRTIEKFEREAKQRNRESWFLAYILDESEEERAKGITIEVGRAHFETDTYRYTILDAPGHKNYVPNMIAGAAQADIGVLVISARKGEFETGFEKGGQTREHALLAKTLGVQYLVVVVNKMDDPTVEWDVSRYEECVGKLKPYLKSCGYVIKTCVKFLPIAGLLGDNILKEVSEEKCPWWKPMYTSGQHNTTTPTLLSTLDSLKIGGRNPNAPLRIPCLDRYFERGTVVMGKVESGTISRGDEIVVAPTRKKAKVEAIYIEDKNVLMAKPGENVLLKFQLNVEDIQKGFVLCSPTSVCPAVTVIKVQLALVEMLEHRPVFSPGYDAVMHVHTVEIEVTCTELLGVLDKGKALRRPFARQGQTCTALLAMPLSTCMETFANQPSMGRFTLRDEGKSIAIGKILELVK